MKKFLSILLAGVFALGVPGIAEIAASAEVSPALAVTSMTVNDSAEPLGLDVDNIRFGWKLTSNERGTAQASYRIVVSEGDSVVWDSGRTESDSTYGIVYGGEPLEEKTRYDWTVTVWDEGGKSAEDSSCFETGIEDWDGIEWIGGAGVKLLKNVHTLSKKVNEIERARAYICGEGLFELRINGRKVGDYVLTPPPSEYYSRAYYVTYDVADYLRDGQNVIGIMLGSSKKGKYYDNIYLARMLLEVRYADGSTECVVTDGESGWAQSTESPVTRDSYFYGEDQDTTFYEGWDTDTSIELGGGLWREGTFDGTRTVDTESGILTVHSNVGQNAIFNGEYGDFVLETTIRMEDTGNSEPAIGVVFGSENDANFYMWQINYYYGLIRPHKLTNGTWTGLASSSFSGLTKLGEWFDLKLEVSGTTVRTYIDGTLVSTVTGVTNVTGGIGFRFIGGLGEPEKGETIQLDDIVIRSGGEVLMNNDFTSMPQQWTEAEVFSGNIYTDEGGLQLLASNAFTRSDEFSDFVFEADVTVNDAGTEKAFGLYFRKGEGNNAYMWQVNLTTMTLRAHTLKDGVWDVPETKALPSGTAIGKAFRFRLEASGNNFKTYIDGALISDFTDQDSSFTVGRIGFRLESGESNTIANVRITDLAGNVLLSDDFSSLDDSADSPWIFPTRFAPEMTALNTFTIINAEYSPKSFREVSENKYLIDFGQNMSGWVRLNVKGERGSAIKVSYAEHLSEDGNDINGDSLSGSVLQSGSDVYNTYVLNGEQQVLEPIFNYTGFQYVTIEVSENGPELTQEDVVACFVTEKMDEIGRFESSSEVLDGIMKIYMAAQRSNDVGLYLASPHREKDGWLGDAHVTGEAVTYIYDGYRLYEKFFLDMIDNTYEGDLTYPDGLIRVFVPHVPTGDHSLADPPWQSGRFIILWDVYRATGDKTLLETSYDSAKSTLEYFRTLQVSASDYRIEANAFGDWLGFDNRNGLVDKVYLSTAYYFRSAQLFSEIAEILGKDTDAAMYAELAENIKDALNTHWLKENSYYDMNTQSSNSVALAFGFVPEAAYDNVVANLVKNIEECGYVLKTGMLACKTIFSALTEAGRSDVLLKLADQTKYPSLGFMYASGATTLWEYWEPYGYAMQFGPNYQSLNHNMYGGGFATWCYQGLAGIVNEGIAWDRIKIMPANNTGIFRVSASTDTVRGIVSSAWENTEDGYVLRAEIPVGATATICVPDHGRTDVSVTESGTTVYADGKGFDGDGLTFVGYENGYFVYECESGSYTFEVTGALPAQQQEQATYISDYLPTGNRFNSSVTITEVTGRTNYWKIENGALSIAQSDIEYMARFGGLYVRSDDFVYSGSLTIDRSGVDYWDGARFVIGYESPTEFEVIDFQKGGVFYTKRTDDVSTGWQHYISVPYLFKEGETYEFSIKVIEDALYVDVNGERIIDGFEMPEDRCAKGFGVFDSKSAFTIENIVISELEKEQKNEGGEVQEPEDAKGGCSGGIHTAELAGAIVCIGVAAYVLTCRRQKIR